MRGLPFDKWDLETFKYIGEACGGLIDGANKTLNRMDIVEVNLKVEQNHIGFLPAKVALPSTSLDFSI